MGRTTSRSHCPVGAVSWVPNGHGQSPESVDGAGLGAVSLPPACWSTAPSLCCSRACMRPQYSVLACADPWVSHAEVQGRAAGNSIYPSAASLPPWGASSVSGISLQAQPVGLPLGTKHLESFISPAGRLAGGAAGRDIFNSSLGRNAFLHRQQEQLSSGRTKPDELHAETHTQPRSPESSSSSFFIPCGHLAHAWWDADAQQPARRSHLHSKSPWLGISTWHHSAPCVGT